MPNEIDGRVSSVIRKCFHCNWRFRLMYLSYLGFKGVVMLYGGMSVGLYVHGFICISGISYAIHISTSPETDIVKILTCHALAILLYLITIGRWVICVAVGSSSFTNYSDQSKMTLSLLRAHLHQRGAGPPAGAGSVFHVGRVFTLARVRAQFHFTGVTFRGTGSLIYKYRPISAPYSCGSRRRIAPWAISAGAHRVPTVEAERAHGGVNSTTQFLQTDPLRNPRAGSARAPRAFSALV